MTSGLFITASGTGVGKTLVTTLLVRQLAGLDRRARALKPIMTGCTRETEAQSDAALILRSLGRALNPIEIERISPWRFEAPVSPDIAAAREDAEIEFYELVAFCREEAAAATLDSEHLVIEGVGGIMAPLTDRETVADWIAALAMPALLVTGSYLGSLSHTLTALRAMDAHGIEVRAVIVSESAYSPVPLDETVRTIERFARGTPILPLERLDAGDAGVSRAPDLTGVVSVISPAA